MRASSPHWFRGYIDRRKQSDYRRDPIFAFTQACPFALVTNPFSSSNHGPHYDHGAAITFISNPYCSYASAPCDVWAGIPTFATEAEAKTRVSVQNTDEEREKNSSQKKGERKEKLEPLRLAGYTIKFAFTKDGIICNALKLGLEYCTRAVLIRGYDCCCILPNPNVFMGLVKSHLRYFSCRNGPMIDLAVCDPESAASLP